MRGDRRISLRLFLLLLLSGGLMGWMVLVVATYYFVRVDDNQWVQRNLDALTSISPAAGTPVPVKSADPAQSPPAPNR